MDNVNVQGLYNRITEVFMDAFTQNDHQIDVADMLPKELIRECCSIKEVLRYHILPVRCFDSPSYSYHIVKHVTHDFKTSCHTLFLLEIYSSHGCLLVKYSMIET